MQLLDASDKVQAQLAAKLQAIGEELPRLIENLKLLEMIEAAITLSEDSFNAINHAAILRALRPATADKRFEEINDLAASTFSWILDGPQSLSDVNSEASQLEYALKSEVSSKFTDWLKAGSGVFHIVGKPGCGKSTLMKYLVAHDSSRHFLEQWASNSGKQLICSGFFFWRLGSDEQKTMRGLRRGILYDVLRGNPEVARLAFPEHRVPKRHASQLWAQLPELSISESEVKAALDRFLDSAKRISRFKICLFIDGLDEFDEPAESLWGFSSKLQTWAECDDVKLCVSSRGETPILRAFSSAHRITLHTLTRSDVEILVHSRLESNSHFQILARSDPAAEESSRLKSSIVDNAEGVFLWVVLLLKWMEEELATGAVSFQALQRIVETAPQELDQFFTRILKSIPKHHSRGAYFVFAMMLRTRGYCIDHEGYKDTKKRNGDFYELSIFSLSYIFDGFESAKIGDGNRRIAFSAATCAERNEYRDRQLKTVSRLQSWCKSLAEVKGMGNRRYATFTHRSVPKFLSSALQDIAPRWGINDNWIAEGILTTCLAESKAQYITDDPGTETITIRLGWAMEIIARTGYAVSGPSESRIFTLLDEIETTRQGLRHGAPAGVGNVSPPSLFLGTPYWECSPTHGALSPVFAVASSAAVPMISYIMWKLQDPRILNDPVNQLIMLAAFLYGTFSRHVECKFPDVSAILRTILASGISANVEYPQFPQRKHQRFTFVEWHEYLASGQKDWVTGNNKSPWRDTLSIFLSLIAFSDKGTVPDSIWNELEVWLEYGAEVPADVLVMMMDHREAAVGFRFPTEEAEVAVRSLPAHENFNKAAQMEYFQTFKSTTMSSMIRWHNPPNLEVLLRYTDQASTLAENPQEWRPPPLTSQSFSDGRYSRGSLNYNSQLRYRGEGLVWRYGLSWRASLHAWVPKGYQA